MTTSSLPVLDLSLADHPETAEHFRTALREATHHYADGPMEGEAAVVRHGNAVTIGAWSPDLIREVLAGLLAERGLRVAVVERDKPAAGGTGAAGHGCGSFALK